MSDAESGERLTEASFATPQSSTGQSIEFDANRSAAGITRWRWSILLTAWLLLIFGTSCTVVRPLEFFEMVQRFTGTSRAGMERFAIFWGISWFTIVKGWHFAEFAVLTVLCTAVFRYWRKSTDSLSIILAMVFCIAFAASDEWHQSFIPDRYGTVQDVLIDCLGVFIAGGILLARQSRKYLQKPGLENSTD